MHSPDTCSGPRQVVPASDSDPTAGPATCANRTIRTMCTRVHKSAQECTRVHKSAQECTRVHKSAQECTGTLPSPTSDTLSQPQEQHEAKHLLPGSAPTHADMFAGTPWRSSVLELMHEGNLRQQLLGGTAAHLHSWLVNLRLSQSLGFDTSSMCSCNVAFVTGDFSHVLRVDV